MNDSNFSDTGERANGGVTDWIARAAAVWPRVANRIAGRECDPSSQSRIEKFSPRDGSLAYVYGAGDVSEVDEAIRSARAAFADGRWARLPAERRKDVLLRLAELIEAHRDELALLDCLDVGKPISEALTVDVMLAAAQIRFNAEIADKHEARVYHSDDTSLSYQLMRPIGVVAGIVGWNFPLVLASAKLGPVLAAGNSLVLKPSEVTPLSACRLVELALEAGVPEGVLNLVHGDGRIGAALAAHSDVDCVTFTGSTATGKKLQVAAGQSNMKRLVLECGGKSANIVFDDCPDLDAVADNVVARAFWNQGQVCTASSRLLVHSDVKDRLLDKIVARLADLSAGDPLDPATKFGALVSQVHRDKVLDHVAAADLEGTPVAHRGTLDAPFTQGFYVAPVVFDAVRQDQILAREEVFGPVLAVMAFADEANAIRLANDTIYGLSAIAWTRDMGRAHRLARALDVGWTTINATGAPAGGPPIGLINVGGHKQSGIGTEGGWQGLSEYMTSTAVQIFV